MACNDEAILALAVSDLGASKSCLLGGGARGALQVSRFGNPQFRRSPSGVPGAQGT